MACEEFYIDVDGKRVHAKLDRPEGAERGPLAVVFHGFTGHMEERHIIAVAEGLRAEGVSTLRVDLYGHGKSDGAFADHTLYKWVTQGLAVIDYARGLDFVDALYVVGHSSIMLAGSISLMRSTSPVTRRAAFSLSCLRACAPTT